MSPTAKTLTKIKCACSSCGNTHSAMGEEAAEPAKKQTTRMIKCECGECGYVARTTRKWLDTVGAPLCACNGLQMAVACIASE